MDSILTFLLSVIGSLLAAEVYMYAPVLAKIIIKFASRKIPIEFRDRLEEEWMSHCDEIAGNIGKIFHAIGTMIAALRIAETKRVKNKITSDINSKRKTLREKLDIFALTIGRRILSYLAKSDSMNDIIIYIIKIIK